LQLLRRELRLLRLLGKEAGKRLSLLRGKLRKGWDELGEKLITGSLRGLRKQFGLRGNLRLEPAMNCGGN
jgi:hypothetical protein